MSKAYNRLEKIQNHLQDIEFILNSVDLKIKFDIQKCLDKNKS